VTIAAKKTIQSTSPGKPERKLPAAGFQPVMALSSALDELEANG
jgi:hypothetical protein